MASGQRKTLKETIGFDGIESLAWHRQQYAGLAAKCGTMCDESQSVFYSRLFTVLAQEAAVPLEHFCAANAKRRDRRKPRSMKRCHRMASEFAQVLASPTETGAAGWRRVELVDGLGVGDVLKMKRELHCPNLGSTIIPKRVISGIFVRAVTLRLTWPISDNNAD